MCMVKTNILRLHSNCKLLNNINDKIMFPEITKIVVTNYYLKFLN